MYYKLSLIFEPQPEGGYTVTSPLLPELLTEGDTVADALDNVRDALAAVLEIYPEQGKSLPPCLTRAGDYLTAYHPLRTVVGAIPPGLA